MKTSELPEKIYLHVRDAQYVQTYITKPHPHNKMIASQEPVYSRRNECYVYQLSLEKEYPEYSQEKILTSGVDSTNQLLLRCEIEGKSFIVFDVTKIFRDFELLWRFNSKYSKKQLTFFRQFPEVMSFNCIDDLKKYQIPKHRAS